MRKIAVFALLSISACATATGSMASALSETRDWQTPSGQAPTKAEFAALIAACQDKAKSTSAKAPIDGCLADLGLRHTQ
jgi:hypothetical protein